MIVAGGSPVTFIFTDPGSVETGVAKKQDIEGCTVASLQGAYGFVLSGISLPLGPVASVGIFAADGAGGVSGHSTNSENGMITRDTFTGTYTMDSDCTGSFTFAEGDTSDFVIVAAGTEINVIDTKPGNVETAVGKKQ